MIGSGPIAEAPIAAVADDNVKSEIISEILNIADSHSILNGYKFSEDIGLGDTFTINDVKVIRETLNIAHTEVINQIAQVIIGDGITLSELIASGIPLTIAEDIDINDTFALLWKLYSAVLENIEINETFDNNWILNILVNETIEIADALVQYVYGLISETINITHGQIVGAGVPIAETIEIDDTLTPTLKMVTIINEDITVADTNALNAIYGVTIEEGIAVTTLTIKSGSDTYTGWVLNPEGFAVWNYSNYNFNSITRIDDKYIGASEDGLYELDGSTDDGSYITAYLQTAALDFGSTHEKQVPIAYLGVSTDGEIVLKVWQDDNVETWFRLIPQDTALHTTEIELGKGLHGRYWQFELVVEDSTEFDLDSMELYPVIFRRKY